MVSGRMATVLALLDRTAYDSTDQASAAAAAVVLGSTVLSDGDVRTGQAMADVATVGILAQRTVHQSGLLAAQLEHALSSRIVIEQAKGVLAERRRITVDEAFALLRDHARTHNLRLSDLAREVAEGSTTALDQLRGADPRS